ncbi:hypothetical protein [Pseudonocardia sp. HH130630-07]|uniref:hypothetical protein n=1 Tax=Pseudonocardia sp. HH130630-07 TaxID=1690815 RepID=UPI000814EC30|nr:hypothetical protein [Pseudonocardia sp. HH130630-07]ANY06625.1 hypothetical protein AFB00_10330 [Pseudonocardia sp. HH130630-07]
MGFPVVDVSDWESARPEAVGREAKVWIRPPGIPTTTREHDWLFKPVVTPANGNRQGEDWAEKLAAELGSLLGVPCAEIDVAVRGGTAGSVSRNVAPDGWNLVLGSVLLSARDPDYVEGEIRPPGRPGHSPAAILQALRGLDGPPGVGNVGAPAAFVGFLVLDAWTGNQDRHDQNWAVLRESVGPGRLRLAPSFDHASSLGFNLRDSRRDALLRNGLDAFVTAARAHRFEHRVPARRSDIPSLVDVVRATLEAEPAGRIWLERLEAVRIDQIADLVAAVPGLSDPAARFAREMLRLNRERLLDVR